MNLIEAKGLTKTFGDNRAVDGVELSVTRGEVVGFLGPNGAGKSTTMKMISGFLEPDTGSAAVCGHDVQTDPIAAKQKIGYLPEGAPAYSDMVVADFLTFVGKLRGLRGDRLNERLADMAEQINLTEVWDQQIENLSKGYKRRVGIAQALIGDPKLLIVDEPTAGLDPGERNRFYNLLAEVGENVIVILSTHIVQDVKELCTQMAIINLGKLLFGALTILLD